MLPVWILALGCAFLAVINEREWLKAYSEYASINVVRSDVELVYQMSKARDAKSFYTGLFFTTVFFLIAMHRKEQSK